MASGLMKTEDGTVYKNLRPGPRTRGGNPPEPRKPAVICNQVDRAVANRIRRLGDDCIKIVSQYGLGTSMHGRAKDVQAELNDMAFDVQFRGGGKDDVLVTKAIKKHGRFVRMVKRAGKKRFNDPDADDMRG